MAIVINGSGTVTGLAVGGLPDGTVDAGTVAADVATQSELDTVSTAASAAVPKAGGTMTGTLVGSGTSNTVGAASALTLGESNFRIMTGGEQHVLCLDRDNAGGTKQIMQSWNPDTGDVAIGSAAPVAAGRLMIKSTSLTQAQLKLQGSNYSFGAEIMSQNGSEAGTVGNTRCWYKLDLVTNGNTRRMYTASSQVGTDTQYFSTNNTKRLEITHDGLGVSKFTAHAWGKISCQGTPSLLTGHNVSSITDVATGRYKANYTSNSAGSNTVVISGQNNNYYDEIYHVDVDASTGSLARFGCTRSGASAGWFDTYKMNFVTFTT